MDEHCGPAQVVPRLPSLMCDKRGSLSGSGGPSLNQNYFVTGFHNYNKKNSKLILEKIYFPYIKNLRLIEKRYDLSSKSIRDNRKSILGKIIVFLRNIKSNLKKIFYSDKYNYPK